MLALDDSQQSFFVGIRSTFYRLASITGQGLLIILAGFLETATGLEPLQVNIQSTNQPVESTLWVSEADFQSTPSADASFTAFASSLKISTTNIPSDSLKKITDQAQAHNLTNGFVVEEKKIEKKDSWWTTHVSRPWSEHAGRPFANFIRNHFGEKRTQPSADGLVGNAAVVAVKLNQKPDAGKDVVLNTRLKSGDRSIALIGGERLVFNDQNWDTPAYMVIQLDKKLDKPATATFESTSGNLPMAWSITFYILAGFFLLIFIYHRFVLPRPASDAPKEHSPKDILTEFGRTFSTFFRKKHIGTAIAFMLLYRLGEAMLVKLSSPFLLDGRDIGGLGLTTGQVGFVYGTVGVLSLTIGGIIGGIAINRKGLKYWLWPMALCITLPHLAFLYLSWFMPENMVLINLAVAVEQFGYGFGFTAYMMYLIYFSEGEHKTAHYAICTGFMALGMMLPGMIAGWLQELVGYNHFFIFVMLCAIPTLLVIPFINVDRDFGKAKKKSQQKNCYTE